MNTTILAKKRKALINKYIHRAIKTRDALRRDENDAILQCMELVSDLAKEDIE